MRVVFLSNFLNHHQLPFSQAMVKLTDGQYTFVATEPVPAKRIDMGYHDMNDQYSFVLKTYESEENRKKAFQLVDACDMAIIGSAPSEYVDRRIRDGKLTFYYSERLYKNGYFAPTIVKKFIPLLWPKFLMRKHKGWLWKTHGQYMKYPNLYMLCASSFTAGDLLLSGLYKNKTYKWGYFPEVIEYEDPEKIIEWKHPNSILWVGRLIEWKHPEAAIVLAEKLKKNGYNINLNIIGNGTMEAFLKQMVVDKGLNDCVHMLGAMPPEKVRDYMVKSEIFIFTSDYNEGWGAVLNESMNSFCAVVSSDAIGSTKFLIKNGENGLVYKNKNVNDLYKKVKKLIDEKNLRQRLAINAYLTLINEWNAEIAAERVIELSKKLINGNDTKFESGLCSKAKPIIQGKVVAKKNVKY